MRRRIRRSGNRGFAFLAMLFTVTGALAVSVVGLTRAVNQTTLATRTVTQLRQFQAAEGGLDAALHHASLQATNPETGLAMTQAHVNSLIGTTLLTNQPLDAGCYTVAVEDDGTAGDAFVVLVVTASNPCGASQRVQVVRATVELPVATGGGGGPGGAFDYAIAAMRLTLSGNSQLGNGAIDGSGRLPLYIAYAPPTTSGLTPLDTVTSSTVWASKISFRNSTGQPLSILCPNCTNVGVFPNLPDGSRPPMITSSVAPLPAFTIDAALYYSKALEQCQARGFTLAQCQTGTAAGDYHHIVADTTINGATIEGVVYVEGGVRLQIKGDTTIKGTIFHEGKTYNPGTGHDVIGKIELAAGTNVTIDSYADTDVDGNGVPEGAFAPGMAVIGEPVLAWKNTANLGDGVSLTPGVKGFVMAGTAGTTFSLIASSGTIEGGIISADRTGSSGDCENYMGPCVTTLWTFALASTLELGGSSDLAFRPLTTQVPGISGGGSTGGPPAVSRPTVRYWTVN